MEIEVLWNQDALDAIEDTYLYVSQSSPQNALRLTQALFAFGNGLGLFPEKFPICSQPSLRKHKFHCVTFENHLFVYSVNDNVKILEVFHARMNPKKFKV